MSTRKAPRRVVIMGAAGRDFHNFNVVYRDDPDSEVVAFTAAQIPDIADRRSTGFSQGQRVKVAIARAMIHRPQTVLLDEPSNGLDVMTTRALRRYIRDLKADGHSVVLSTHIMQEVAALCDRVIIIAKGRIAADGTPEQLISRSGKDSLEDAFVALIGTEEGLLA